MTGQATIHTVFTTECGEYFGWQSMGTTYDPVASCDFFPLIAVSKSFYLIIFIAGMIYSHRKAGQPGPLTRIMSCTPEEWAALSEESKNVIKTHVAPSYTHHPRTGDVYSAYNKPVAVIDWLARNEVKEDYVLIIDADMIMRSPFLPEVDGAAPGRAVSAFFGYMKGVNNKLAMKHVPEVLPRNDSLAGPKGRRGDQVGGFTMMYTEDLRRVAPLWLKYTEDVRADPDAWELTGDAYSIHPGDKPWISEMYGYSFACSKSNVWHICHRSAMLYPGYEVVEPPKVLHYGLYYEVANTDYKFDKHWHYDFNPFKCPPWDLSPNADSSRKGGLLPHPPRASSFKTKGAQLLRDLLAIEVPVTLNAAFCEHHRTKCLPSEELERECGIVDSYAAELDAALAAIEDQLPDPCSDRDDRCPKWAQAGECDKNVGYMLNTCPYSCKACTKRSEKRKAERKPAKNTIQGKMPDIAEKLDIDAAAAKVDSVDLPVRKETLKSEDAEPSLVIPELKLRCTRFPEWTIGQVERCMTMAKKGQAYDPVMDETFEGAASVDIHSQAHRLIGKWHDVDRLYGDKDELKSGTRLPAGRIIQRPSGNNYIGSRGVLLLGISGTLFMALIGRWFHRRRDLAGKLYLQAKYGFQGRPQRED